MSVLKTQRFQPLRPLWTALSPAAAVNYWRCRA